ncbi:MAG: C39 family peptidase [Verrucomicrobiota bacterium]|nr:C39 family peptidase [Verrucomicrobiota bacterium]
MPFFLLLIASSLFGEFSRTHGYPLTDRDRLSREFTWEFPETAPFNELILTWNAKRPSEGRYSFFVSLHQQGQWSPWLYTNEWGDLGQIIFLDAPADSFAASVTDAVKPKQGMADGFRIKVVAAEVDNLSGLQHLWATISNLSEFRARPLDRELDLILLPNAPRQSQITLRHPRSLDLSLPTAMSTAMNTILQRKAVNPSEFCEQVIDSDTDFYESWVLNAAEASNQLGSDYAVRVERLADFETLHTYLLNGSPVLIPIRGSLPGGPRLYYMPHILCVIGYNPEERKVYCIDSGFPSDKSTFVSYKIEDFLRCWNNQKNIATVFQKLD